MFILGKSGFDKVDILKVRGFTEGNKGTRRGAGPIKIDFKKFFGRHNKILYDIKIMVIN